MKLVSFPDFCHNTYMTLSDFGYQHYLHKLGAIKSKHPTARIIAENKTDWNMISEKGKLKGIIMTSFRKNMLAEQLPKVGDYVEYEPLPNEAKGKITKVLPRFSELARQLTEQQNQTQMLIIEWKALFPRHHLHGNQLSLLLICQHRDQPLWSQLCHQLL